MQRSNKPSFFHTIGASLSSCSLIRAESLQEGLDRSSLISSSATAGIDSHDSDGEVDDELCSTSLVGRLKTFFGNNSCGHLLLYGFLYSEAPCFTCVSTTSGSDDAVYCRPVTVLQDDISISASSTGVCCFPPGYVLPTVDICIYLPLNQAEESEKRLRIASLKFPSGNTAVLLKFLSSSGHCSTLNGDFENDGTGEICSDSVCTYNVEAGTILGDWKPPKKMKHGSAGKAFAGKSNLLKYTNVPIRISDFCRGYYASASAEDRRILGLEMRIMEAKNDKRVSSEDFDELLQFVMSQDGYSSAKEVKERVGSVSSSSSSILTRAASVSSPNPKAARTSSSSTPRSFGSETDVVVKLVLPLNILSMLGFRIFMCSDGKVVLCDNGFRFLLAGNIAEDGPVL